MPTTKKGATSAQEPSQVPTGGRTLEEMEESKPSDLTLEQLATTATAGAADAMPTLEPPPAGTAGGGFAATWQSNKTISALWSINQNRNAWAFAAGVGWVKLLNSSDNIIMQLTILTASAKQTGGPVSYRTEADNTMHEIYIW